MRLKSVSAKAPLRKTIKYRSNLPLKAIKYLLISYKVSMEIGIYMCPLNVPH